MCNEELKVRVIFPDGCVREQVAHLYISNNYTLLTIPHRVEDSPEGKVLIPDYPPKYQFKPTVRLLKYGRDYNLLAYVTPGKIYLIYLSDHNRDSPLHMAIPPSVLRYNGGNTYSFYFPWNRGAKCRPVRMTPYSIIRHEGLVIYRLSWRDLGGILRYLNCYIKSKGKHPLESWRVRGFHVEGYRVSLSKESTLYCSPSIPFLVVDTPEETRITIRTHGETHYTSIQPSTLLVYFQNPTLNLYQRSSDYCHSLPKETAETKKEGEE